MGPMAGGGGGGLRGRPEDWESISSEFTPHFATSYLQASALL